SICTDRTTARRSYDRLSASRQERPRCCSKITLTGNRPAQCARIDHHREERSQHGGHPEPPFRLWRGHPAAAKKVYEQRRRARARAVKRIVPPLLSFKSFRGTRILLARIELMHMIKKGQLESPSRPNLVH